jgi:hypothetical protein
MTRKDGWFHEELASDFSRSVAARLSEQFVQPRDKEGNLARPRLRLSQMGPRCPCALWHSIHHPELREAMPPWAEIKFSFGHILEALSICLSKAAGHSVTGEQDEITVDGVLGHRDCIIDGCLVDVKSASSIAFGKFKDGSIREKDSFGYLEQLDSYLCGSMDDPLLTVKDRAYLLAIDKQLGHMCLYEHRFREEHIRRRISDYRRIVSSEQAPTCTCGTVPEGKSGNIRLDTIASYSPFKYTCFPNLRTFIYASGPVYLTKVVRVPDVPEINKDGKVIYG